MKRILSIFVYALAIAFNSNAQEKAKVVVNGLRVCEFYSREQMYEALGGTPDKIEADIEDPGSFSFYYGKDMPSSRVSAPRSAGRFSRAAPFTRT